MAVAGAGACDEGRGGVSVRVTANSERVELIPQTGIRRSFSGRSNVPSDHFHEKDERRNLGLVRGFELGGMKDVKPLDIVREVRQFQDMTRDERSPGATWPMWTGGAGGAARMAGTAGGLGLGDLKGMEPLDVERLAMESGGAVLKETSRYNARCVAGCVRYVAVCL